MTKRLTAACSCRTRRCPEAAKRKDDEKLKAAKLSPSLAALMDWDRTRRLIVLRLVGGALVLDRIRVHRADERDDFPQIIRGLDNPAEGRHRADHDLRMDAAIAGLLQSIGAERDQAEQRVIVWAVDPGLVGERGAHAATATAAMTTIAAEG